MLKAEKKMSKVKVLYYKDLALEERAECLIKVALIQCNED